MKYSRHSIILTPKGYDCGSVVKHRLRTLKCIPVLYWFLYPMK